MALTLYGERKWYSPYFFTAFVGLTEKGLPFEVKELDLSKNEAQTADYADKSITAKVPALDHDGFVFAESMAIAEYLAETFPYPKHARLFPENLKDRARCRQVMLFIRTDLLPLREERSTETMFYTHAEKPLSQAAQESADKLLRVANKLIPDGKTQLFKEWCIADSDLAFCLQRLGLNGHELPKKIRAYVDVQWNRPSVQAFVNHPRPAE